ncbi:hypothetical protein OROGR_018944 [Orobanche gracilis]
MVSTGTRGRGRPRKNREEEEEEVENEGGDGNIAEYEESRAERIKENAEKMKSIDLPLVSYIEKKTPKKSVVENVKIYIEEGEKPEVYTKGHEKLLGEWSLRVFGICLLMDTEKMDSACTILPKASRATNAVGSYIKSHYLLLRGEDRYGENIKEVNENSDWLCPVCREICNCSRCRRDKGWMPTGAIYNSNPSN